MLDARNYSSEGTLKDGTPVTIRAIRLDDRPGVISAFKTLDPEAIYTRFFTYKKSLTEAELQQITDVDFTRMVALVVTTRTGGEEKLIGGGRYASGEGPKGARSAELAFLTSDQYRGRRLAALVLDHLIQIGRACGVKTFEAVVLPHNRAMLSVFRKCGLPIATRSEAGVVHVVLDLDGTI